MKIPGTLADTLKPDVLAELEQKLAPPRELRAKTAVEIEIEAAGEGTFTILIESTKVTAKKGFAKAPLIAASIAKGGWPLLQRELQAVVDGFPGAPALQKQFEIVRQPKAGELDVVIAALKKLDDACVSFDIKGAGKFAVARGPIDEATRVLHVALDASEIDKVLAGAPVTTLRASIGGDRGVLTAALAAIGPVVQRLRS